MNIISILQNPVILGLVAGLTAYFYMKWQNDKDKKKKNKDVNLLIPLVIFIAVWFLSYAYMNSDESEMVQEVAKKQTFKFQTDAMNPQINDLNNLSETSEPVSFNLISNGIQLPKNINIPPILFELNN
jgi:hypothetical protein